MRDIRFTVSDGSGKPGEDVVAACIRCYVRTSSPVHKNFSRDTSAPLLSYCSLILSSLLIYIRQIGVHAAPILERSLLHLHSQFLSTNFRYLFNVATTVSPVGLRLM
jgi:hypothetical protein